MSEIQIQNQQQTQYLDSTVRSMASDTSTAGSLSSIAAGSWLGGKKRDWDNAFISKYQDLEATLQENDQWLTMYLESISGMKNTKKPHIAISEALKTSSVKRRGRSRMDVRDVFAGKPNFKLSPLGSKFNTATIQSLGMRMPKRRGSSQYGTLQGNTLNMTIAQMGMLPPKSPYLATIRQGAGVAEATVGLARSNSAAAKTAAAVKQLERMEEGSASGLALANGHHLLQLQRRAMEMPMSASSDMTMASPGVPMSALSDMSMVTSPQQQNQDQRSQMGALATNPPKFTLGAPVPTLRDMLLNHHHHNSPPKPPIHERAQSAGQKSKPFSTINMALGGLSLQAKRQEQYREQQQQQAMLSSAPSSVKSSPDFSARTADQLSFRLNSGEDDGSGGHEEEEELTKSEDEVRDKFQKVRIAFSRSNTTIGAISESPEALGEALGQDDEAEENSASDTSMHTSAEDYAPIEGSDIETMLRNIDDVSRMLPPSPVGPDGFDGQAESRQRSDDNQEYVDRIARSDDLFVDVVIDRQPMDVRLGGDSSSFAVDDVSEGAGMRRSAGSPPKRKLSDSDRTTPVEATHPGLSSSSKLPQPPQSRLMAPTASSLARGRGRGRGRTRPALGHAANTTVPITGISRKPVLRTQTSATASQNTRDATLAQPEVSLMLPPRSDSRAGYAGAGGLRIGALVSSSTATGPGRVAEFRRKFEPTDASSKATSGSVSAFANPVVTMRPGYAGAAKNTTKAVASSYSSSASSSLSSSSAVELPVKRVPMTAAAKSQIGKIPSSKIVGAGQKSSTVAMREAARKAEAARINAAAATKQQAAPAANEQPLFKSVARPGPNMSRPSSQSSLRSQTSDRRSRPTPLPIVSTSNGGTSGSAATAITMSPKGKAPVRSNAGSRASGGSSLAEGVKADSVDSGRWGLSSVISMLSPSSWKSQTNLVQAAATASAAATAAGPETPTVNPAAKKKTLIASPYDVNSPQTPYQPRPEHGGGNRAQLVMPTYKDMAVPLRRTSDSRSSSGSSVGTFEGNNLSSSAAAGAKRPSQLGSQKRLINIAEGRLSGVSSFRSSFFSDDEGASTRVSQQDAKKRSPSIIRMQSTPDLHQAQQQEQQRSAAAVAAAANMVTPLPRGRVSNYTSIIPDGSNSPPEIESDYSDEYSDEEFSPAPKRKNDFRIPSWATTPELARGLMNQERVNPDRIFGRVKPLRVNDIFNRRESGESRRKPRNSSMIWTGSDALTADDELEYIRRMGFDA